MNHTWKRLGRAALLAVLPLLLSLRLTAAQDSLPVEPPPVEQPAQSAALTFTEFEPKTMVSGQAINLSIFGAGFGTLGESPPVIARLEGFGALNTTRLNDNALVALVPPGVPPGVYRVLLVPEGGAPVECACAPAPNTLTVLQPTPTAAPPPTQAPPPPPPTPTIPPTDIPGTPNLLVRSYNANPPTVLPGGVVTLTVDIVNQGTRPALGLSVAVDPGGSFIPANGQATILLPDLAVGANTVVAIPVSVAENTAAGPQTVGITMAFRDFTSAAYTSKGTLTVNVGRANPTAPQVTLARYLVNPSPVETGKEATITILLTNTGNAPASQVLLKVGDGGVLLPGPQGDTFPVGDLAPGASRSIDLPLVVSTGAKSGPQPQNFDITFLQGTESKSARSSITVPVAQAAPSAPVLLLDSFSYGKDFVQPGEQFTVTLKLKNVGKETAESLLVTFGQTVPPSTGDGSGGGSGSGSGSGSATPSTTFAPVGSGGAIFAGEIDPNGGTIELTQDFIVNATVDSGVFPLPVALRYQRADGTQVQETLNGSVVVVQPPRLGLDLASPLPDTINLGEPLSLTLNITNRGRKAVLFNSANVEADNADVVEGADTTMNQLRADDQTQVNGTVIPSALGPVKIVFRLNYTDDLNKAQTITREFEVEAVEPPPRPTFEPPPDFGLQPTPDPQVNRDDLIGRLLLGLLGLGS